MADVLADPDYLGLRAAVLANPADDAPRLILADWWEEHGLGELAEFVRWQVGHRRSVEGLEWMRFGTKAHPTHLPQTLLMSEHLSSWFAAHSREVAGPYPRTWTWTWWRGFVARLRMPADDALDRLPGLLESWPITTVVLTARPGPANERILEARFRPIRARARPRSDATRLGHVFGGRVRFREDYGRPAPFRPPSGFRTTLSFSRRPHVNIWETTPR